MRRTDEKAPGPGRGGGTGGGGGDVASRCHPTRPRQLWLVRLADGRVVASTWTVGDRLVLIRPAKAGHFWRGSASCPTPGWAFSEAVLPYLREASRLAVVLRGAGATTLHVCSANALTRGMRLHIEPYDPQLLIALPAWREQRFSSPLDDELVAATVAAADLDTWPPAQPPTAAWQLRLLS